jgi:flagellar biosynthesis anti-sigma factor FlgM
MKVNDPNMGGLASTGLGKTNLDRTQAAGGRRGAGSAGAMEAGGDQIQLSNLGQGIRALSSDSPERTSRVEQLAADVASGNYRVDAKAVSKGIVEDALGRGGAAEASGTES